jgi:hypothetical protein
MEEGDEDRYALELIFGLSAIITTTILLGIFGPR